jgi:hypothetical protein
VALSRHQHQPAVAEVRSDCTETQLDSAVIRLGGGPSVLSEQFRPARGRRPGQTGRSGQEYGLTLATFSDSHNEHRSPTYKHDGLNPFHHKGFETINPGQRQQTTNHRGDFFRSKYLRDRVSRS